MALIRNGKFFQLPVSNDDDFKALFARVAAAGIGRPVDRDGCPQGPWTPELLADAISQIEVNRDGIELRTVQLWFENNDRGIGAQNIRWLARVLGCNDPAGTSAWQAELSAAQGRLAARRRQRLRGEVAEPEESGETAPASEAQASFRHPEGWRPFRLARVTEAVFGGGSLLNLPAYVFAGAVALQLVSWFLSIHDVTYLRADGVEKQVGFLWAPNWTFLFIVFLPLFLALVGELVTRWKGAWRSQLLAEVADDARPADWLARVGSSSHAFWVVFLICLGFAGVLQWISVRLLPLLNGGGAYAADWGSRIVADASQIGNAPLIAFTAAAYLYMSMCFYLLVAGLILLCNLVDDFVAVRSAAVAEQGTGWPREIDAAGAAIMTGIIRCTIAGLLVATCMKLQSLYLVNSAPDILSWLLEDAASVLGGSSATVAWGEAGTPTNYTSLLVVLLVAAVYLYGAIRVGRSGLPAGALTRATAFIAFLLIAYFLMGAFAGFSLLLGAALFISVYGLFDPHFELRQHEEQEHGLVL